MAARAGAAIGVVVILAAVLGPSVLTSPPPTSTVRPTGTATAAGPTAATPTGPLPTTAPAATLEPWPDLVVPAFEPMAQLVPSDHSPAGIATDASFSLRSLTATPAVELAHGLRVDPPIALDVEAGPSADVAVVRPVGELAAGLRYRFRLDAPDGSLAGTWAFVARTPLRIVGTLPGDQAVGVPVNTGIEITFDQDGSTGVAEHFSIEPATAGRFEPHGRTWAFIPEKPLSPGTIYTVKISSGVGIADSDEVLGAGVTFRFETAVAGGDAPRIQFGRPIIEIRPDTMPVVLIEVDYDRDQEEAPDSVGVRIHRLPNFGAVVSAATKLAGEVGWALASPAAIVSTAGLDEIADVEATVVSSNPGDVLQIPVRPASGYYIATIDQPGAPAQLLLQVTNLSAYALTATQTTVVWVNDLASDRSIAGATVETADGRSLGRTDTRGVLSVGTPQELANAAPPDEEVQRAANLLVAVAPDGRRLLVPIGLFVSYSYNDGWYYGSTSSRWWQWFRTDRSAYRQTDTIHVSGVLRARSDRSVPDDIELRLRPAEGGSEAPILRVPVTATQRGVFTGDIALDNLPRATYSVDLFVGQERVTSAWITVMEIRKPAYRIEVTTERHVFVDGEQVRISTAATFFDGTVVPDMELRFAGFGQEATATTSTLGEAAATLRAEYLEESPEGWHSESVSVAPARPEEGEISGSERVFVFPSRAWIRADGSVSAGRIVVTGLLSWADLVGFEAELASGGYEYGQDPSGKPIPGGTVRATVTHLIPVRRQVGTSYDFIEKKVVPVYEYDVDEVAMGSPTLTAATDGTFRLSMAAPVPEDGYRVTLTTKDPEGRQFKRVVYASTLPEEGSFVRQPYLTITAADGDSIEGFCGGPPQGRVGLDEQIEMTMRDGDGSVAADGRFMFLVGQEGSVAVTLQDAATFRRTMRESDLPSFTVRAVWLSARGYTVAHATAAIDLDDKTITMQLTPDKARYAPGETVSIDVTTKDPDGQPVAADVVVQGVDEKLYALGLAADANPLWELMMPTSAGFLQSYRSHANPNVDEGGCGDEGGDGERDDFRDTVTFQRITTDAAGRGKVTFKLSDDLTSWHMSAVAVTSALDAGHADVLIPVGLPFFVDAVIAPEFLVGDLPVLRLRAYGGALASGDPVTFTVEAPSLGLAPTTVRGTAFTAIRVPLLAMTPGDHRISIKAAVSHAGTTLRDALVRTVRVVETRLAGLAASYDLLQPGFVVRGGDGLTTYVISDAGRGRLISLLQELASSTSARFDRAAAAEKARELLVGEFDFPSSTIVPTEFSSDRYQVRGIALLPYASDDLFLSARAALVAGSEIEVDRLREAFYGWNEEGATRERQIVLLAGLAALGDDVLGQLAAYDPSTLTVLEQLWLALGLAAAGDEDAARAIERGLLEAHGQQLGPWVRLAIGRTIDDTLEPSGLLLLLAARLGDPLAHGISQYLVDHPSKEFVFPLEQLGYAQAMLERLPRVPGRFAWTVGGERHEVDLRPGGGYSLVLTKGQRATLALERLEGELAVVTAWTSTDAQLPSDPAVSITRTVTPAGSAPDDRLVRVRLEVRFGPAAPAGCYRVTDLLPSGLAPVAGVRSWDGDFEEIFSFPYQSGDQRVSWCTYPDTKRTAVLTYAARVVTPGTYLWEQAIIQSEVAPTIGSSTPAMTYTIR